MTSKYKKSGWYGESYRHSLARRGIRTKRINYSEAKLQEFGFRHPTKGKQKKFPVSKDKQKKLDKEIHYQYDVTYSPVAVTVPEISEIPETVKRHRLEKGWIKSGIKKEAEVAGKAVKGAGKVAKGFLGTVFEGLSWQPEEKKEIGFSKKVKSMAKTKKSVGSDKLAGTMARFVKRNIRTGEKLVKSVPVPKR